MGYALVDVDLGVPLPTITLTPAQDGVAVVARDHGEVVGFAIEPAPAGSTIEPRAVRAMLGAAAAPRRPCGDAGRDGPPGPRPTVTVAVCTRDRPERLARCLDSIGAARERDTAVLVVDNAPPDERTRRLVDGYADVAYVREPRAGLDFARNRALQEATTDVVAFVDDDVTVDRDYVRALLRSWARDPDAAAVTGLILPAALDTDAQVTFERRGGFRHGLERTRFAGPHDPDDPRYPWGPKFGSGANMALRRAAAVTMGGFDEALDTGPPLPGGGDLDMMCRVLLDGRVLVYDPAVVVFHEHRRTMRELRRQYWSWGESYMAFVSKWWWADASARPALRLVLRWWFGLQLRRLRASLRNVGDASPALAGAELAGGIVGLVVSYRRSVRRVDRIRRRA